MKNKLLSYLKRNEITEPYQVDKLLISTFININNVRIKNNSLILDHIISKKKYSETQLLNELTTIIKNEFKEFGFEELISLFEFVISPSDRVIDGAVYTPLHIRDYITNISFKFIKKTSNQLAIADISCGCGGFLFTACMLLKKKLKTDYYEIFKNNIYGIDIQAYSANRTKLLLSLLAIYYGEDRPHFIFNIYVGDSLSFDWKKHIPSFRGFDLIIGNPPYVCSKNLSKHTKNLLKNWSVSSSGNPDLYIPFFQIGLENLSENGALGYITMNSFFKSLNGRALREYFHQNNIIMKIIDFGSMQIFDTRNTYTCICILRKSRLGHIEYYRPHDKQNNLYTAHFEKVNYNLLDHKTGWNLHSNHAMGKIESTGIPFGQIYKTRHGIATLKNNVYIFTPKEHDDKYYYISDNDKAYKIEKTICRDIINSNKINPQNPICKLTEKLIFPYTSDENPKVIDEYTIQNKYPHTYQYLSDKKNILQMREKGENRNYPYWYAYGRTQSLHGIKNKLFLPKISKSPPHSIISTDEKLMFYNGIAVAGTSLKSLLLLQKIMSSKIFWFYIKKTSKPYSSNYFSLTGNYIRNFGIYQFSPDEIDYIIEEKDNEELDNFIEGKYGIIVPKDLFDE